MNPRSLSHFARRSVGV